MRIEGGLKLRRQMRALKGTARKHITKAVHTGTEEGVRIAKVLAPDTTGKTKSEIVSSYKDEGMTGIVVAIESDASGAEKNRAYSIEHGRKVGNKGKTEGSHHIHRTRTYLAKKNKSRMRRALNKAIREAAGRG